MITFRLLSAAGVGAFVADAFTHSWFDDSGQSAAVAVVFLFLHSMFVDLDN